MGPNERARRSRDVRKLLEQCGGELVEGHFELASGNHSRKYLHVRLALAVEECARRLALFVLDEFREKYPDPTIVVSWTLGGRLLASAISALYGRDGPRLIHLDRSELTDNFALTRDDVPPNSSVLLVDDVLTTGETLCQISDQFHKRLPGALNAVATVAWLGPKIPNFGTGTAAIWLTKVPIRYWPKDQCPECKKGIPYENFRDASVDPLQPLYSLSPGEADRFARQVARLLKQKDLRGTDLKRKVARALKSLDPVSELPGTESRRVVVLGSMDSWHLIKFVCRVVSESGYYAVTSHEIYEPGYPDSPRRREQSEEMGVTSQIRQTIAKCGSAIVTMSRDVGGQLIENEICFESQKRTLGLVEFRRLWPNEKLTTGRCRYLKMVAARGDYPLRCGSYEAVLKGHMPQGGKICVQNHHNCPFPYAGVPIMALEPYGKCSHMSLVGSDDHYDFRPVIERFVTGKKI